jgi:HEAT repeat protein
LNTSRAPQLSGALRKNYTPQLGGDAALKHIVEMMHSEDIGVRQQAVDRLEAIGTDRALEMLLAALEDKNRRVRDRALVSLGYLGDPRALDKLISLFSTSETVEEEYVDEETGEKEIHFVNWPSRMDIVEAVGQIGDPRGLAIFASEALKRVSSHNFHFETRISWAIASIGARAANMTDKQEAARRFVAFFPRYELANKYIINRLPWEKRDLLDTVASLLADPDASTRHDVACFLAYFGDGRGQTILLSSLREEGVLTEELASRNGAALNALMTVGCRQVIPILIDLLDAPFPPEYAIRSLDDAMQKWASSLTTVERKRLTRTIPITQLS